MSNIDFVYHGTNREKTIANPIRHKRVKKDSNGNNVVIFDHVSFHASPLEWIALAYTYSHNGGKNESKAKYYISVDLYVNKKEIEVYGHYSLEKSLDVLYGAGGYLLKFSANDFFSKEGLGCLERITQKIISPLAITFIKDPVSVLKEKGVSFVFFNLG